MWRRRRLWITLLAVPLLLVAADTVYWRIAERNLADGFAAWAAERQATGWHVAGGKPRSGGWPFAATLTIPGLTLDGGNADVTGGLSWTVERLVLRVSLLRPRILEALAEGNQRLRADGNPPMTYTAGQMRLVLPVGPKELPDFIDLAIDDVHVGDARLGSLKLHLDFDLAAQAGQAAVRFAVQAAAIVPPASARPLGEQVDSLSVDGALNGPLRPARTVTEQARAWRDAGGALVVRHLALTWGPLDLAASATLTLDDQLQWKGEGDARVRGYAEALDALAAHGAITRSAATAAKAILSLLATMPADGSAPTVDVPLTLRSRTLSMHEVPLLRLPELDWPQ